MSIQTTGHRVMATASGKGWAVALLEAEDPRATHPYVVKVDDRLHGDDCATSATFTYERMLQVESRDFFREIVLELLHIQMAMAGFDPEDVAGLDPDTLAPRSGGAPH